MPVNNAYQNSSFNLTNDGVDYEGVVRRRGCFVSRVVGIVLAVCVVTALVLVGVLVHVTREQLSDAETWEVCQQMAEERGECLCFTKPAPTTAEPAPETTTEPPPLPTGLRLPKDIYPIHYNVELKPYIYGDGNEGNFSFDGSVEMWVDVRKTTNQIIMNIDALTLAPGNIEVRENDIAGHELDVSYEEDEARQLLKITATEDLTQGKVYYITMSFTGTTIHDDLGGFYRSSYQEEGVTKWLVTTQFQRSNARRAFPCFDEPSFKATFDIILVRKTTHTSISNMEQINNIARDGDWVADVYNTTVKMSSYLLAFVVSEFESVTYTSPRGTVVRIWARPAYVPSLEYALPTTAAVMEAFEDYTGIPFPLPKTDQIAIPDFAAGAMENWGLVTYREKYLCYNETWSTTTDKFNIADIIGHELAHMWWGNLVTCDWWDDTWLNEGYATYFADYVMSIIYPTWKMDEYFMRRMTRILNFDSYGSSQPVYMRGLEHHSELRKAFSTVTYNKGGSLIRMMRNMLTEDTFRKALENYLNDHAYGTVISEDMYRAFDDQATADGTVTWDSASHNYSTLMRTWFDQMNHPLVSVKRNTDGNVEVRQQHFLYDTNDTPDYDSDYGFKWDIYFTWANETQLANGDIQYTWFYKESDRVEIPDLEGTWQLVNYIQQGFFRVRYSDELRAAILEQLNTDHTVFPVQNRHQLLDDAFALAEGGGLSEVEALKFTEYLGDEQEYLPWYQGLIARPAYVMKLLYQTSTYQWIQQYFYERLVPVYEFVTWDNGDPDEHIEKYLRAIILRESCKLNHGPCVTKAKELYKQLMDNPDNNPIHPDLRPSVYCEGVRNGGWAEYQFADSMYQKEYTEWIAFEKTHVLQGMSCTRTPWILTKYLDLAVSIKSTAAFNYAASDPSAQAMVWEYLLLNWESVQAYLSLSSILTELLQYQASQFNLDRINYLKSRHPDDALDSTYSAMEKAIQENIAWLTTNEQPIQDWLKTVVPPGSFLESHDLQLIRNHLHEEPNEEFGVKVM